MNQFQQKLLLSALEVAIFLAVECEAGSSVVARLQSCAQDVKNTKLVP
jgi:hypothetical protein